MSEARGVYALSLNHVDGTRSLCEEPDLAPCSPGDGETRTGSPDVLARPARELAACRGGTADDIDDLVKAHAENVVQQESRPLQRRQPLEGYHPRHGSHRDGAETVCAALPPEPGDQVSASTA